MGRRGVCQELRGVMKDDLPGFGIEYLRGRQPFDDLHRPVAIRTPPDGGFVSRSARN